jgi:membrane carboxypeptidase/penicillin-binding protein
MTLRKTVAKIAIAMGLIIVIFLAYSIIVIFQAHYQTKKVVADLTSPEFMKLELTDFSADQLNILLAVEDPTFYEHPGYDLSTPGAGWTTITQGLVKLYYFDHFKPGFMKIRQTLIAAYVLNPVISKRDQLRLFINKVYLGHVDGQPVNGFAQASRVYFHKEFANLTRDQYIAMVAMIIAPRTVNVLTHPEANAERVRRIINLVDNGYKPNGWSDVWLEGCK